MTRRARSGSLALLRDFRLLVYLFVAFRLMLLIVYQPLVIGGVERGLTAGGDFPQYYAFAQLSDDGILPFRDYWTEYPPVWPVLYTGVYRLTGGVAGSYTAFASLLGLILVAADTGNLILLRLIGTRLHGVDTGLALAWIYAMLLAPTVFLWWNFEALVAFALLLALWWLLTVRDGRSALAILFGALVKFVPLIMLGAVWRYRTPRQALRYTLLSVGGFALVYLAIVLAYGDLGAASLVAQFGKSSYGTVWALIDGNYATGVFGPMVERFDAANALLMMGNPAVIPSWVRLLPFAGFGLYAYVKTRRFDDRGLVAFVTLTLLVFFLWAQGWSPQWLALIIPLVLLSFPNRGGVLVVLLLSLMAFTEYPLLFIRTGDTGGVIEGALRLPFVALVLARTVILVGLVVALLAVVRQPSVREVVRER